MDLLPSITTRGRDLNADILPCAAIIFLGHWQWRNLPYLITDNEAPVPSRAGKRRCRYAENLIIFLSRMSDGRAGAYILIGGHFYSSIAAFPLITQTSPISL